MEWHRFTMRAPSLAFGKDAFLPLNPIASCQFNGNGAWDLDVPTTLYSHLAGNFPQPVLRYIEHAVGKTPFVVEPDQQIDQPIAGRESLTAIDNG